MDNIGTLDEARALLATNRLSAEKVRMLFRYVLQREEETRELARKTALCVSGIFTVLPLVMAQIARVVPPEEDTLRQLGQLLEEMQHLFDALHPKVPLH